MPFNILTVFATILSYRLLFCLSAIFRTIYYERLYNQYLAGKIDDFAVYTAPIKKLMKQAGVSDTLIPHVEYVGFNQIRRSNVSLLDNLHVKQENIVGYTHQMLSKAKGTFRMNLLECISPLYWLQLIFFLPVKLCGYLGYSENGAIPKLLQLIYWITTPLLLAFRSQLYQFIIQLFQQAQ